LPQTFLVIDFVAHLGYMKTSLEDSIMPTTANSFVRARVNQTLRDDAGAVLQELGLTISDVMRMTLTRIAKEKEVPFELFVPNAETRAAIEEARAMRESRNLRYTNAQDMIDGLEEEAAR